MDDIPCADDTEQVDDGSSPGETDQPEDLEIHVSETVGSSGKLA